MCLSEFKGREWLVSGTVIPGFEGASEHIRSLVHCACFPPFAHKFACTYLTAVSYPYLIEMLASCTWSDWRWKVWNLCKLYLIWLELVGLNCLQVVLDLIGAAWFELLCTWEKCFLIHCCARERSAFLFIVVLVRSEGAWWDLTYRVVAGCYEWSSNLRIHAWKKVSWLNYCEKNWIMEWHVLNSCWHWELNFYVDLSIVP
jgi:hypothetical protein